MGSPVIWFDATTIMRLRSQSPVGLSRVEAHVLMGALKLDAERVGFSCYNRYQNVMEKLARSRVEALLAGYGQSGGHGHGARRPQKNLLLRALREIERGIRVGSRRTLGHARQWAPWDTKLVRFNPGDIFVLSGATWDMVDAAVLEKMINRDGVCLVVLIADMIPWRFPHQYESERSVSRFLRLAELAARRASLVLSISRTTSEDFAEFASEVGVKPGRMEIIHLGASSPAPQARQPAGMPEDLLSSGYVLSVGTIQVRKNHQLLYQLWRRFAEEGRDRIPRLVLAGSHGWLTDDLLIQIRTDLKVRESIIVLNSVDDAELSWLYGHAKFTLYPSFYEGWGLPIVESFQHSKPCLASNTSSMPEASQGLATHLDPLDFMTWRQEIIRRFEDPSVPVSESEWIRSHFRPRSWQDFSNDFAGRVWSLANSSANEV
ncbi:MAG: glycosyltransferase family 1 protein [Syntrophobacteraceae bacterium]